VFDPNAGQHPVQTSSADFVPDAPPTVGVSSDGFNRANSPFITGITVPPPPPPKPAVEKNPPAKPVPVGGDVQMAKLLRKVIPEYPALARMSRVAGTVRLIGIIGKDGTIQDLQVVSGNPLLTRTALDAVRQWVYKPTLLNGQPVEVMAPIEVNFTLGP
jgi:protein TonB